jgi:hypothetical protein
MTFGASACLLCFACTPLSPAGEHDPELDSSATPALVAPPDAATESPQAPAPAQSSPTSPPPPATSADAHAPSTQARGDEMPHEIALPADWADLPREKFSADLDRWLPIGGRVRLDADSIATLGRALWPADEISVRAAAILGRTLDPRAGAVLLARLEARVPERPDILFAGDFVAASAFSCGMSTTDAGPRLEALARGPKAHPVLDVRVECAAASVFLGRDGALPFLLALLREGTPAQDPRPDWTRLDPDDERLLRLQDRAARVLSDRVGIQCAFRAHASIAARESETTRLANLVSNLKPR